jgi:isoquinoline 1-oxidoreductase beta subunit
VSERGPERPESVAVIGELSRRDFLRVSGGAGVGLVVAFALPACSRGAERALQPVAGSGELNAYIRIAPEGETTLTIAKAEMGQGVYSSLSRILADELGADWSRVRAVPAPVDAARYGEQLTGGSSSVRRGYEPLRRAGAAARELLIAAAAAEWKVPASECRAENGRVIHVPSNRSAAFGALATRASSLPAPSNPALRPKSELRLIGRPGGRIDTPAKVDGSALFGIDVRLPGMRFAQVERCPTLGGKLESFDAKAALAVPGVLQVFEIPSGVAVVATGFWAAKQGREKLSVRWSAGPHGALDNDAIRARCAAATSEGATARDDGDVERALASAAKRVEALYEFPYLAHATLEPMNCTARVTADACELWVGTQSPDGAAKAAAAALGIDASKVRVNQCFLGGGFGRRSEGDFVTQAVAIAKQVDAPVQLVYTREDDMRGGFYRPVGANAMLGGLDAEGWPIAWQHRIASASIARSKGRSLAGGIDGSAVEGARNLPYAIPNLRVTYRDVELPIATHWWRSVGSSQNAWVTECFFDELCAAGGKDPVEARLRLLSEHPRHRRALERAAREAGYGQPLAAGHAHGVAVHESFGSIVAQVAEVSLDADARPRVHRVVCAVDCGEVVDPDGVRAQMESGIAYGLSAALTGEVRVSAGRIASANFGDHPILRIGEMPRVDVVIIAEGDPIGGIGEPGTPPIAPAVCNALLRLTGKPVRRLPILHPA